MGSVDVKPPQQETHFARHIGTGTRVCLTELNPLGMVRRR